MYFFLQAEDGIRAGHVTGVQTCALPICRGRSRAGGRCPGRLGPARAAGAGAGPWSASLDGGDELAASPGRQGGGGPAAAGDDGGVEGDGGAEGTAVEGAAGVAALVGEPGGGRGRGGRGVGARA